MSKVRVKLAGLVLLFGLMAVSLCGMRLTYAEEPITPTLTVLLLDNSDNWLAGYNLEIMNEQGETLFSGTTSTEGSLNVVSGWPRASYQFKFSGAGLEPTTLLVTVGDKTEHIVFVKVGSHIAYNGQPGVSAPDAATTTSVTPTTEENEKLLASAIRAGIALTCLIVFLRYRFAIYAALGLPATRKVKGPKASGKHNKPKLLPALIKGRLATKTVKTAPVVIEVEASTTRRDANDE